MNPLHLLYRLAGTAAGIPLEALLRYRHRNDTVEIDRLDQRFGRYAGKLRHKLSGKPRLWLHAVSVGEVGVAAALVDVLRSALPGCDIVLSTATRQGQQRAEMLLGNQVIALYAPFDINHAVIRALKFIRPDLLAILETEIWPNLIVNAHRLGARTALLNGRISVRTIKNYQMVRPLIHDTLANMDVLSMISQEDALRIQSIGADKSKVSVNGNAKFDCPDPLIDGGRAKHWARTLYGITDNVQVFVAGSTRDPEEQSILNAFCTIRCRFPQALLIIAPRHVERTAIVEQWVRQKGLTCQRRTALTPAGPVRTAPVIVLDTIGELSDTYSVADIVFCGGSLVAKGGQNPLEPALWAKPIMYGPSMEDFADALQLIERNGGGVKVAESDEMASVALAWLSDPARAIAVGLAARAAIVAHRGAAQAHVETVLRLLELESPIK